jgi:hypothetical protein
LLFLATSSESFSLYLVAGVQLLDPVLSLLME